MPLTPADVHNVAFKKPPIGKRGYDEDEVDAFLDLVETEFARLIEENNELRSRTAETPDRPVSTEEDQAAPPPDATSGVSITKEQVPEERAVVGDGDELSQATRMLALATETADRHVGEAKAQADRLLADARTSSEQMISDSTSKSEEMLSEAETRAQTVAEDAERKRTEVIGALEQRRTSLEQQIEDLRTFEREYRTRLKSYLESQLRELDVTASGEPTGEQRPVGAGQSAGPAQNSANPPED